MSTDFMDEARAHVSKGKRSAEKTGFKRWLPRIGYAAKGIVYLLVGVLAVLAALGEGGQTTDSRGALQSIANEPFGQVILFVLGIGLFAYAIWRFVQSLSDPENNGRDSKALLKRGGYLVSGIIYASLGVFALSMALGSSGGSGGGGGTEGMTAKLMSAPGGQWLVAAVGVIIGIYGLIEFYRAMKRSFLDKLRTHEMSRNVRRWVERTGMLGLCARGVVFLLIGAFFVQAAVTANPNEAGGLSEAFNTIAAQPWGSILLFVVALGVAAYGVYQLVQAYYRKIRWA